MGGDGGVCCCLPSLLVARETLASFRTQHSKRLLKVGAAAYTLRKKEVDLIIFPIKLRLSL